MLTVVETPEFSAWARQVWSDEDREAFIGWIASNPEAGDAIPGAGGLRKVRWRRAGMGKRGGARVIYDLRPARHEILLIIVYAKAKFDNLRPEFLLQLKARANGKR